MITTPTDASVLAMRCYCYLLPKGRKCRWCEMSAARTQAVLADFAHATSPAPAPQTPATSLRES